MAEKSMSQQEFVKEWFRKNPDRDIPSSEYKKKLNDFTKKCTEKDLRMLTDKFAI